ncbi:N-methyl-L-tryptophan oxidase [Sphaerobacter thermophilus]|uniref:Sarcosine oxidase n=1 Tax=Sphaerobacter thermophilus (strain ATCC 49802 / DSM 20745 / KCCM 41009 / NCIMB 13125 / S 6022) TaxID=479434 RepID=D1C691_SPHTD|nr:N-methyl-L-tryptophan oxidase [Sphaerobacter thermophilus]ACZ37629.1 Sarcosine oxidase [Sphaerobacter thermophilus DSM 20745]
MAAQRYDSIVVGLGGMGSAALYHLARRGDRVLGLEQFDIPHAMGSSHGVTRIIRLAYFEHPSYVPLLRRAYELWRELETRAGEPLLIITGSIDAGPEDGTVVPGALRSCAEHDLPHEVLSAAELHRRFPGYCLPDDIQAVFQPEGGFLRSEQCIVAHVMAAAAHGAEVHGREPVTAWEALPGGAVRVRTARGTYEAERLVLTAGAWASRLVKELQGLAVPERQVLIWMQPRRPELFTPERFPVFNMEVPEGHFYGFPVYGIPGFKFGLYHHLGEVVDPNTMDREAFTPRDEEVLRSAAERYFPDAAGPTTALKACMFTNSPDEHFIIDHHPDYPQVTVAAGFSGHGYKFCSVVGEILADLSREGTTRHDIGLFRLDRFANAERPAPSA